MGWRTTRPSMMTPNHDVPLDRAGITVFRDITFLAPARQVNAGVLRLGGDERMAGPVASVLLREKLTEPDRVAIRGIIDNISDHDTDKPPVPDAFWVCDTISIGGTYSSEGRPFAVFTGLQPDWEPEQLPQVAGTFGFTPVDEILIVAFCNSDEDHRILGELSVRLLGRFGGLVSFGGALWPPIPPEAGIDILYADWRQVEPHFRRMVEALPGKVVGLKYEPQPGREWVVHVADVAFLRAWLGHPRFRMVK